jgi:putative ubiquitin-RnfH superfamily antitoxin RatB of RatAB toxin-antitoxin module
MPLWRAPTKCMAANSIRIFAIECFDETIERAELNVPAGSNLMQALQALVAIGFKPLSQRLDSHSLDELITGDIGVNGKRAKLEQLLRANDRIEFYRPLLIDNKQARQLRVLAERKRQAQVRSQPKVKKEP